MKTIKGLLFILLCFSGARACLAQSGPPPVPTPPPGRLLDAWEFSGTNYLSLFGYAPTSLTNVALVSTWDGNGLQVDDTNAAWIVYPVVEPTGHTNLSLEHGTVETWLSPDWNSTDGLGAWGTIFEVGNWSTNLATATGSWGLFVSPDGSELFFSSETNGVLTNYLSAPISWNAGDWHHVLITYSTTNSELYLEGQFVTNGPGMSVIPSAEVLSNGFSIGSDSGSGLLQSRAVFNQFIIYSYQLDAVTISNNYSDDSQNVYPLPSSGFGGSHGDSAPGVPGGFGSGGTNSGGGASFYSPVYGSNDFWIEALSLGTNAYNTNTNSLTLIIHGTTADTQYQLWSTTNLQGTNTVWALEQTLVASSITNFTPTTVSMTGRPTLFFKASNFSLDTDNIGLPDSWQLQNFGYVGVDPYGDVAGDGWNNEEKYAMGVAPSVFVTPAPSSTFAVSLNTNGNIIFKWQRPLDLPSGGAGAVSGYTITYSSPGLSFTTNLSASQTNFNVPLLSDDGLAGYLLFPTDTSGFWGMPTVTFRINYANTNSQIITNTSPFDPACFVNGAIVRGTGGETSLVISSPSESLRAVRLISITGDEEYPINEYGGFIGRTDFGADLHGVSDTNFGFSFGGDFNYTDIPLSSFTNGIYQIPPSLLPVFSDLSLNILGVGKNGNLGSVVIASPQTNTWDPSFYGVIVGINNDTIPFMDGRTNIAQNISFLLRGAGAFAPFDLSIGGAYDIHGYSNYVTSGFSFVAYDRIFYGLGDPEFSDYTNTVERNEFEPFEESGFLTNILFSTSLFDAQGNFTNQVDYAVQINSLAGHFPTLSYATANSNLPPAAISAVLNPTSAGNILSYDDFFYQYWVIDNNDGSVTFPSGAKNWYGLPYTAVTYFGNDQTFDVAHQGDTFYPSNDYFFQTVTAPTFSTVAYYFARPRIDPVPGEATFTVTNSTKPYCIIPFGTPFTLTAWAKQTVNNAYSGVYAYPQQYFDKAYLADTNGNFTTNETGMLSEYGDFFSMQPGKVFLTTKPDAATGTRGTNTVYVLKLQTDVNHDGVMDLSFGGADNTSPARPHVMWVNNNFDRWHTVDGTDSEQDDLLTADSPTMEGFATPDGNYHTFYLNNPIRVIPCTRDLEDFARLWVCGVDSNLLAALPAGSTVSLNWGDVGNANQSNPKIDLFMAADPDGGIGYLTNATTAAEQTNFTHSLYVGRVMPGQNLRLNASQFTNNWAGNHFIWCGVEGGSGGLNLTVSDANSNVLAQSTVYIKVQDIKQMYERWTVGDNSAIAPTNVAHFAGEGLPPEVVPFQYPYDSLSNTNTPYILHVHGSNMKLWEKDRFAETMYKRLYWQGYQGRFGSFRWPSQGTVNSTFDAITRPSYFYKEEYTSWLAAPGLKTLLAQLNSLYPGQVRLSSHSMGNVGAQEALKQSTNGYVVSVYAPFQGAVASHSYNSNAPTRSLGVFNQGEPDTYAHYYTSNSPPYFYGVGGAAKYANFYNTNDFVLLNWNAGQNLKPDPTTYAYSGGEYYRNATTLLSFPEDTYELFAFCVQAPCFCIGEEANVGGVFVATNNVDLHAAPYSFGDAHKGHSAQFRSDNESRWPFYSQLMTTFGVRQTQ